MCRGSEKVVVEDQTLISFTVTEIFTIIPLLPNYISTFKCFYNIGSDSMGVDNLAQISPFLLGFLAHRNTS